MSAEKSGALAQAVRIDNLGFISLVHEIGNILDVAEDIRERAENVKNMIEGIIDSVAPYYEAAQSECAE